MIRMLSSWSLVPPLADHHGVQAQLADPDAGAAETSLVHRHSSAAPADRVAAAYSSSVTWSPQVASSSYSHMARWVM